jgi:NADH dehydrogenase (ubiquinone) Fe-S protein 3
MQKNYLKALIGITPKWIQKYSILKNEMVLKVHLNDLDKIIMFLKNYTGAQFKLLTDITAVDYPKHEKRFELVYIILGIHHNMRIIIQTSVDVYTSVQSITSIFPGSNWYERETWDMFGVFFKNHLDLRRILTDYGFDGHPLRKDFPLSGFLEVRYNDTKKRVISEFLPMTQNFRFFNCTSPWEFLKKNNKV